MVESDTVGYINCKSSILRYQPWFVVELWLPKMRNCRAPTGSTSMEYTPVVTCWAYLIEHPREPAIRHLFHINTSPEKKYTWASIDPFPFYTTKTLRVHRSNIVLLIKTTNLQYRSVNWITHLPQILWMMKKKIFSLSLLPLMFRLFSPKSSKSILTKSSKFMHPFVTTLQ